MQQNQIIKSIFLTLSILGMYIADLGIVDFYTASYYEYSETFLFKMPVHSWTLFFLLFVMVLSLWIHIHISDIRIKPNPRPLHLVWLGLISIMILIFSLGIIDQFHTLRIEEEFPLTDFYSGIIEKRKITMIYKLPAEAVIRFLLTSLYFSFSWLFYTIFTRYVTEQADDIIVTINVSHPH